MSEQHLIPADSFGLGETLDCGQAFRWQQLEDGSWEGIAGSKYLKLSQTDDGIVFHCPSQDFEAWWKPYFDLSTDYNAIKKDLCALSPVLSQAASFAPGIRILRQDPWEALCSFIFSQNNNIPRIKGIISRFCRLLGDEMPNGYSFPNPQRVAQCSLEDLADIRSGFRAKYILSAAQAVAEESLDIKGLYTIPLPQAREQLMTIKGVGPKVADCVLLYGFHRTECFPLDVWMKRAMEQLFPGTRPEAFGEYAGMAQQYIFHYSRMNPQLFEKEEKKNPKKQKGSFSQPVSK